MIRFRRLIALSLFAWTLAVPRVFALTFEPTNFEWSTWPDYCKARYVVSGAGKGSKFATAVSRKDVEDWAGRLRDVWPGFHHYCAATIIFERGRTSNDALMRGSQLNRVIEETDYTLARSKHVHPMVAKMLTLRGRALWELGKAQEAITDFKQAIGKHPDVPDGYAAYGFYLRRAGKKEEARDVLAAGVEHCEGNAELHYLLGIVLAELKQYDSAADHARIAYSNGYPLPGLKRKLKAAGHWN